MTGGEGTPPGSGIYGRPVLDQRTHLTRAGNLTYCGRQVPADHVDPPRDEMLDHPWLYQTCWPCDLVYRQEHDMVILPGHPAAASMSPGTTPGS
jgi:hypothetical protein